MFPETLPVPHSENLTLFSNILSALDSAVLTVGTFNGGYACNVIADKSEISGTVRAFEEPVMDTIHRRVNEICCGIHQSFNVDVQVKFNTETGYPVTRNTSQTCVDNVRLAASKVVPKDHVVSPSSTMAAEDFSFFLNEVPGCFFFVGAYPGTPTETDPPQKEYLDFPHHKSNFDLDEDSLGIGASIWVQLVEDLLVTGRASSPKRQRIAESHQ